MMSVAILEDEPLSSEFLISALRETEGEFTVVAVLPTVREAKEFFSGKPAVDLILSDVQLRDGLSFSVFESMDGDYPIIFISAYDQYVINAFEHTGIDYLLKPVTRETLTHSINKYRALEKHFLNKSVAVKSLAKQYFSKRKSRLIVKRGASFISLNLSEIVLFYTENLVVYAIDSTGNKYMVDKNLNALEQELDEAQFFRANRQYILNVDFVNGYKNYERVKLLVSLKTESDHVIVIGQEKAKSFRRWLAEA